MSKGGTGRSQSELAELLRRVESDPGNVSLRVAAAVALRDHQRPSESVAMYQAAIAVYRKDGRIAQAKVLASAALMLEPQNAELLAMLSSLGETSSETGAVQSVRISDASVVLRDLPVLAGESIRDAQPLGAASPSEAGALKPAIATSEDSTVVSERRRLPTDMDDGATPLPAPMPYHIAEPTRTAPRLTTNEFDGTDSLVETDPFALPRSVRIESGLSKAARAIGQQLERGESPNRLTTQSGLKQRFSSQSGHDQQATERVERISQEDMVLGTERVERVEDPTDVQ